VKVKNMISYPNNFKKLKIIDAHAHLGPTKNMYVPGNPNIEGIIQTMDRIGIDQIFIAPHIGISCDYILGNNLILEAVQKYPSRVVALATANINYNSQNIHELDRCFKNPVFKGIKLHPDFSGYSVNDLRLNEVFKFARDHGAFIVSHSDARVTANHLIKYSDPSWFEPYLKEFKEVDVIMYHCGLTPEGFEESVRLSNLYSNAYLDTTGWRFSNTWTVEEIVRRVGARKLLYGSDMPYNDAVSALGRIIYANISEEDKHTILYKNALDLLRR
jgi:uncharacterized protein